MQKMASLDGVRVTVQANAFMASLQDRTAVQVVGSLYRRTVLFCVPLNRETV